MNPFDLIIVQPIFNLLVFIYSIIPGHNFGLAVIIFTIIIRLILCPLVKKQLHQTKFMRELQPKIKEIKAKTKGNRQEESRLTMELYKERGVNPFGSIGVLILQIPILIGLYAGLRRVVDDPNQIIQFAYPALQHLPWMQYLADHIHQFDDTLFGVVNLTRSAVGGKEGFYLPAFILVVASAITQYYQSKQLMPDSKDSRGLRAIMRDASAGKQTDQAEVSAAVGRGTKYFIPVMIFVFTISLASALSLYFLVSGLVAFWQQKRILDRDETEMEKIADSPSKNSRKKVASNTVKPEKAGHESDIIEGELIAKIAKRQKKKAGKRKKRKGR
jgi:YidC/Oxa1 family membrane protein insertase